MKDKFYFTNKSGHSFTVILEFDKEKICQIIHEIKSKIYYFNSLNVEKFTIIIDVTKFVNVTDSECDIIDSDYSVELSFFIHKTLQSIIFIVDDEIDEYFTTDITYKVLY